MAIPAWKLQLQQNIAKKNKEKQQAEEQRRIQMLPPWKRAALQQQQTKNVIIISNTSSNGSTKPTTTVSNSTSKTVITNSHKTTNNVNTVNSNNQPRTVSIVTANQRSPTHSTVTIKPKDSGGTSNTNSKPANHVSLKQAGKSKNVDANIGKKKPSYVSSNSLDQADNDSDVDNGVSDDHCVSVHNNHFLRREKKMGGLARPNFGGIVGGQAGLGNRQKVQDSMSPNSTSRVAWKNKSNKPSPEKSPEKSTTSNKTSTKNNIIITDKLTLRTEPKESDDSERQSRTKERKLSVNDLMKQFGRAASHEEKQKIRRQGSLEERLSPRDSPRSVSTHGRDYSTRERSPSPLKNRYRSAANAKPRPKSTPVEISTSVILSQPVRKALSGANSQTSGSNKVAINTSSKQPAPRTPAPSVTNQKTQKAPAPKISVSDSSKSSEKPPLSSVTNGFPASVILINKKHLDDIDTHDAGRTPPPRRKTQGLPASAIIDLNTAGPIQQASGKPPVDPEIIAKEKAISIPKNAQNERKSGTHIKSRNGNSEEDTLEKPKPNTVSNLLGAFGQNKSRAPAPPSPLSTTTSVKEDTPPVNAVPYSGDWRRPKSWQEKQQEEKQVLPSQANLKRHTDPVDSEKEKNEKNASISRTAAPQKPVELSPIPRPSLDNISPIPKSETILPIPNREIISSDIKPVTQNGHIDSKADEPRGKGEASKEMMEKARALKKVKKKVNYEVIGGNAPTSKPSAQSSKSNRNRDKTQLKLTFREEPEEYEYQSEASLLAEYGDEEDEEEDDGRHSSVSEDEEPVAPAPSGFRDNMPKETGGLQSYTPSYLRDLTPSMMREQQEATRRKKEAAKQPEPEPMTYDAGDDFSSAGSSSAAMLF